MAKTSLVIALMTLFGATSGCVTSDTLIKLNPDGSGVVVQKTLMSTEMLSRIRTTYAAYPTGKNIPKIDITSKDFQILRLALRFMS